jgi:hypothetical protein
MRDAPAPANDPSKHPIQARLRNDLRTNPFVRQIRRFVRLDKKNINEFSEQFGVLSGRTKLGQLDTPL